MDWKQFPGCETEKGTQTEPSGLPELRKKRLKFGKAQLARIFWAKDRRRKSYKERVRILEIMKEEPADL